MLHPTTQTFPSRRQQCNEHGVARVTKTMGTSGPSTHYAVHEISIRRRVRTNMRSKDSGHHTSTIGQSLVHIPSYATCRKMVVLRGPWDWAEEVRRGQGLWGGARMVLRSGGRWAVHPRWRIGEVGGGGWGVNSPPPPRNWGFGKRAQLIGPLIGYYELWRRRGRKSF